MLHTIFWSPFLTSFSGLLCLEHIFYITNNFPQMCLMLPFPLVIFVTSLWHFLFHCGGRPLSNNIFNCRFNLFISITNLSFESVDEHNTWVYIVLIVLFINVGSSCPEITCGNKEVRALRGYFLAPLGGYFWPPRRLKNKNCFSALKCYQNVLLTYSSNKQSKEIGEKQLSDFGSRRGQNSPLMRIPLYLA